MTDEVELLREFRAETPAASDAVRRRAYAQATQPSSKPTWRSRITRPRMLAPVALAAAAASLIGVFVFANGSHQGTISNAAAAKNLQAFINGFSAKPRDVSSKGFQGFGHGPGPTIQQPLGPPAKQMTLADASAAWGSPLVLPSTAAVQPSDAGPVWEGSAGSSTTVAVTFPSQGLIIGYMRPGPYSDAPTGYQQVSQGIPGSQIVDLSGTPALVISENSDETGANFGVVAFEINGTEVRVMGHDDAATLEAIAQSILSQFRS